MSWFTGDDGKRYEIFGAGGGQRPRRPARGAAARPGAAGPELREGADTGHPIVAEQPDSEAGQAFAAIAERIDVELAPTRRFHPELKLI